VTTVVQISDTHFGTERPEVVHALTGILRQMQPGLVILSGDVTQRARRTQFTKAAEFVAGVQAPALLAIPGNHDIPLFDPLARSFFPYANYSRAFGRDLEPSFESPELLVLTVKTTRRRRHIHGEVSAAQIDRVTRRLRSAQCDQLRVVVTHQPVHVTRTQDEKNLLRGGGRAVASWCEAGVDLILGGHIHLPYVRPLSERYPDLGRRAWAVQAGTAVSRRTRDGIPNSFNVILRPGADRCQVERWDYDAHHGSFQRIESHAFELDRR
jgi:3',5'-cyclic AMP phosphodiesterase CpdA